MLVNVCLPSLPPFIYNSWKKDKAFIIKFQRSGQGIIQTNMFVRHINIENFPELVEFEQN